MSAPTATGKRGRDGAPVARPTEAPAAPPQDALEKACMPFLVRWFEKYGRDAHFEIEARIREVTPQVFAFMLAQLDSFTGWQSHSVTESMDTMTRSNIRVTRRADGSRTALRKDKRLKADVTTEDGHDLRFSVATETAEEVPEEAGGRVRLKKRHSYNHKNDFLFDLTEVRSGRSEDEARRANVEYEVELEWCGQRTCPDDASLVAKRFLAKMKDLLVMKTKAERSRAKAAPPATASDSSATTPAPAAAS